MSPHCLLRAIHCALSPSPIVANFVYGVHHSFEGDAVPGVNCIHASLRACASCADGVLIHPGLLFFARAWFGYFSANHGILVKSIDWSKFPKFALFTCHANSGNILFASAGFVLYKSKYV